MANLIKQIKINDIIYDIHDTSAIHEADLGDSFLKKTGDWMTGPFGLTLDVGYGQTFPVDGLEGQMFFLEDESSGTVLPPISDTDNNKFLRVVNGKPAWVEIPVAEEASF